MKRIDSLESLRRRKKELQGEINQIEERLYINYFVLKSICSADSLVSDNLYPLVSEISSLSRDVNRIIKVGKSIMKLISKE